MKSYSLYYTTSRTNATLHLGSSTDPVTYFVRTKLFTLKPQISLRLGSTKTSPMVAFARVQYRSKHLRIGTGDFEKDSEASLKYEEIHRDRLRFVRSDYEFATDIGTSGEKKAYGWVRDKTNTYDTVYHCVDENENIVASLKSGGMFNWKKGGEIDVDEKLPKEHAELLIVAALAIWVAEAGWSVFKGYESHKGEVKDEENDEAQARFATPEPTSVDDVTAKKGLS